MAIARVEHGQVLETRDIPIGDVPPHKRSAWLPIVGTPPTNPTIGTLTGPTLVVDQDQVRRVWAVELPALDEIKTELKRRIDEDAERCRLQFMTPGAGMSLTYREKFEQAASVNALGQAAANDLTPEQREASYPTLSASVGIEAATLWDCAQLVLQRYAEFAARSLQIERVRLTAKKAISDSTYEEAAVAAYEAATWPGIE